MRDLDKFVSQLKLTEELAVEVRGNARLFCDAVSAWVSRVVVVNHTSSR